MNEELVSVIVPIYNVEKFLKECLYSIVSQTYKNLEIILIDDGSSDDSGKIADEFLSDRRVIVKHKKNGGLSDARNFGLKISKGKYVCFVDSDDVLDYRYVEILYQNIKKHNANIAICNFEKFVDYYNETVLDMECKIYSSYEYFKSILCLKNNTYATSCIIERSVIKNILFPVGVLYEDMGTMYKIYYNSTRIVVNNSKLYKYRIRENSIVSKYNAKYTKDYLNNCLEMCNFIEKSYFDLSYYTRQFMCNAYTYAIGSALDCRDDLKIYQSELKKIIKGVKVRDVEFSKKIKIILFKVNIKLGTFFLQFKRKIKGINSFVCIFGWFI